MPADSLDRLERLFRAAQMHPPEERAAFLEAACADDPVLRQEVANLLQAGSEAEAASFLSGNLVADLLDDVDDRQGQRFGSYTLLRRLGQGGMGDVYLSIREHPFKQFAAIKIIRRGMDTREVVARFEMERQILAALNHPHIGRLYDGGVTEDGLPFFVMEFVDGLPITRYCDEHHLSIRERLRLFLTVCHAVHHAHQNLIVHRDLKPSNILVTKEGTVKLLDFGIAKLLNPSLSPVALPVTRTELRVMTPEYASPEQIRGETLSTASDVYTLGVILYELLSGHRPYRLEQRSLSEVLRVVCEQEPERPSTKVRQIEKVVRSDGSESAITPDEVGAARDMPPERLRRHLRGDLDNIALKALRKEPDRRYASAEQLAQDVEQYLHGLPVKARAGTYGYRIRKFVSRHRAGVMVALFAVVALIAGLGAALWQASEAQQERDRAEEMLGQSQAVTDYLIGLFEASDPWQAPEDVQWANALLQRGVERAESLKDQPAVKARILETMGRVYIQLGQYDRAQELLEQSMSLRQEVLDNDPLGFAEAQNHLAQVHRRKSNYREAVALYRQSLEFQRQNLGARHPAVARTLQELGNVPLHSQEERAELYREALDILQEVHGPEHPEVASAMVLLASPLRQLWHFEEAERLMRQAVAIEREVFGPDDPRISKNMYHLADLLWWNLEGYEEAEQLYRRGMAIVEERMGRDHPNRLHGLSNLAALLARLERYEEAEALFRESIEIRRNIFGAQGQHVAEAIWHLARYLHYRRGRLDEADSLYQVATAMWKESMGDQHSGVSSFLVDRGILQVDRGEYAQAERLYEQALELHLKTFGPVHDVVAEVHRLRGLLHVRQQRYQDAETHYREALRIYRELHDESHSQIREIHQRLIELYELWNKPEQANDHRVRLEASANARDE